MKRLITGTIFLVLLASCTNYTDVKNHEPKPGDTYCTYTATGAGSGSFTVCVYCPTGASICGTIKKARVLREYHYFMPNEYDHFDLTPAGTGCNACTGIFYWEKE